MFLRSDALPDPGSEVRLLFHTREGTKVEVTGIVVWNTKEFGQPGVRPGFGVRFRDQSTEYREFYEQILLY